MVDIFFIFQSYDRSSSIVGNMRWIKNMILHLLLIIALWSYYFPQPRKDDLSSGD